MPQDFSGFYLPRFYNDSPNDPLIYDQDQGLLAVRNDIPAGFIASTFMADAQNRLSSTDGINRPRPGKNLLTSIAGCTRVNGMQFISGNTFLIAATVSGAAKWYKLVSGVLTDITGLNGAPAFTLGSGVYLTRGLICIYASWGQGLYKWDGTTWTQLDLNMGSAGFGNNISVSTYFTNRIIAAVAASNSLQFSDFLGDGTWDPINLSLQVDAFVGDRVMAVCPHQQFNLVVAKTSEIFLIDCNPANEVIVPTPSISNFPINKISSHIGCCEQKTMKQCSNDVYFLSESGRGVFSVGQIATNEQQAIKNPLSLPIKGYINRINWTAINTASAIVWDDLYMLSVPIDSSATPNALLIYSVSLGTWQGIWTGYNVGDFALQLTGSSQSTTDLYFADNTGNIYSHWRSSDLVNVDTIAGNIAGGTPFLSSITTRSYRYGEEFNLIQPFNFVAEFVTSSVNVTAQLTANGSNVGSVKTLQTFVSGPNLPIPKLPFNLPYEGTQKASFSARPCNLCNEAGVIFNGTGAWNILMLSGSAWIARGVVSNV